MKANAIFGLLSLGLLSVPATEATPTQISPGARPSEISPSVVDSHGRWLAAEEKPKPGPCDPPSSCQMPPEERPSEKGKGSKK
jgi:hypothetical protein